MGEEDFKCYKCMSGFDDYCTDIDALKAAGDDAQRDCSKYKQCMYPDKYIMVTPP